MTNLEIINKTGGWKMNSLYIEKETENYVLFSNGLYFDIKNSVLTCDEPLAGINNTSHTLPHNFKYREVIPQLELPVTHRCNLNCTYCSFRGRMKNRTDLDMQWDTINDILSYYRQYLEDNHIHYARVDYGVTGEPYLRENMHNQLTDKIKQVFDGSTVERVWAGPYISNGTLPIEKDIAPIFCDVQDVSCDGPKHVHDSMRQYPNGSGSFDKLMEFVDSCNGKQEFGTSAVLTTKNPDFVEILSFLFEKKFPSIYMKPVNARPTVEYGLNKDTVDIFKKGYSQIVDYLISLPKGECLQYLLTINKEDFFLRFFFRIKERSYQIYRCGCGKSGLYIDTDGLLYPCAHFMGLKEFSIGNVHDGVNEAMREKYRENTVDQRKPCNKCWARYVCGGGCLYQSYMANDTIFKPDEAKCELIKYLIMEAVRLYSYLSEKCPDVLSALPSPFYMNNADIFEDHEKAYLPKANLILTDDVHKTVISNMKNRKSSLKAYSTPEFSFTMKDKYLHIICENLDAAADTIRLLLFDNELYPFLLNDLYNYRNYRGITEFEIDVKNKNCIVFVDENQVRKIPYLDDVKKLVTGRITVHSIDDTIEIVIPIKELWNRMPNYLGLNLNVQYTDGGFMPLVVFEPFISLSKFEDGNYTITGGEFSLEGLTPVNDYNKFKELGMMPISRWRTVVPNVC